MIMLRLIATLLLSLNLFGAIDAVAQESGGPFRARWRAARPATPPPGGGGGGEITGVTELLSNGSTTCTAPTCTSSGTFSVTSGELGLLFIYNTDDSSSEDGADAVTSITHTGQTWTEVTTLLSGSLTRRITAYCTIGAGAAAAAVTANFPNDGDNQNGILFLAAEVAGADTSGDCEDAIRAFQTNSVSSGGSGLAGSGTYEPMITLSSRGSGTAIITAIGLGQTCTETARQGYTNLTEASYATPTTTGRMSYVIGGQDTVGSIGTLSACNQNSVQVLGVSVEVSADASGGDNSDPVCQIQTPTTASTFSTSTAAGFILAGQCVDSNLDTVDVTCPECAVTGSVTGTGDWTSTHTLTCSGGAGTVNNFTVTGTDDSMNEGTDTLPVTCVSPDSNPPVLTIQVPSTNGTTTPTASQNFSGVASDDTAVTEVTWSCPNTTCTPDSGTATGTTSWSFSTSLECSSGSGVLNTVRVVASDAAMNTTTQDRTITCATSDATIPTVTITSNCGGGAGANCTTATMPQVLMGTAADNVALRASNPVTGTSPGCVPSAWNAAGSTSWTSPAITCPGGSTTHTVVSHDAAGNDSTPDTQAINFLTINATSCNTASVGVAYTACTLSATGGSGTYTWTESGSNLGTGACDNFTLADSGNSGIVDDTGGTPTTAGVCSFTAQVSDGSISTTRQFSFAVIDPTGEGPHDYFDTWKEHPNIWPIADCASTVPGDNGACSLRNQAQLNALCNGCPGGVSGGVSYVDGNGTPYRSGWTYEFGTDTHPLAQDAAKAIFQRQWNLNAQEWSVSGREQLDFFPARLDVPGDSILIVWDYWWSSETVANHGDIVSWKTFMYNYLGANRVATIVDWIRTAYNSADPDDATSVVLESTSGMGGAEGNSDPDCIANGGIGNGTTCEPRLPAGLRTAEAFNPAGAGAPPQRPIGAPQGLRTYKDRWTRYWVEIRLGLAYTSFTDWNAQNYCPGPPADPPCSSTGMNQPVQPNPQDASGRWNMISIWRADEGRDAERILFRVPVNFIVKQSIAPTFTGFTFENNTSKRGAAGDFLFYARDLFMLKNYNLPSADPESDPIFQRPVR